MQAVYTGKAKKLCLILTVSKILKHCQIHPHESPELVKSAAAKYSCARRILVSQEQQDKADST